MPYKRKKTGSKKVTKTRINPQTGSAEEYTVLVDLYEDVWESDSSSSYGSSDSSSSSGWDSGSCGSSE